MFECFYSGIGLVVVVLLCFRCSGGWVALLRCLCWCGLLNCEYCGWLTDVSFVWFRFLAFSVGALYEMDGCFWWFWVEWLVIFRFCGCFCLPSLCSVFCGIVALGGFICLWVGSIVMLA